MDFSISYQLLILLFVIAFAAGFIDTLAGGGGLLTLPVLLSVGLPPAYALATNKMQSFGGVFSSTLYFVRHKMVDLNKYKWAICCVFIGSIFGVNLVRHLNADFLRPFLPILLIVVALYYLFSRSLGSIESSQRCHVALFAIFPCLFIGFYDGFFGPGTGSFFALAFIVLQGLTLCRATAYAKVFNLTSNVAALIFFIFSGHVIWAIGITMLIGQMIGARFAAKLVMTKGQKLIRPLLIIVSLIMSGKLLFDTHHHTIVTYLNQLH